MPAGFPHTLAPPHYAVTFTAHRTAADESYDRVAKKMFDIPLQQRSFLGAESTRDDEGLGVTVSYWRSKDSILKWKALADHLAA